MQKRLSFEDSEKAAGLTEEILEPSFVKALRKKGIGVATPQFNPRTKELALRLVDKTKKDCPFVAITLRARDNRVIVSGRTRNNFRDPSQVRGFIDREAKKYLAEKARYAAKKEKPPERLNLVFLRSRRKGCTAG